MCTLVFKEFDRERECAIGTVRKTAKRDSACERNECEKNVSECVGVWMQQRENGGEGEIMCDRQRQTNTHSEKNKECERT